MEIPFALTDCILSISVGEVKLIAINSTSRHAHTVYDRKEMAF